MKQMKQTYNINVLYFSEKLSAKLDVILKYPFTFVEAPMGYGKTTAIRKGLQNCTVLWQTVFGAGNSFFWSDFCDVFLPLSAEIAVGLRQIGFPGDIIQIRQAVELIGRIKLSDETTLVIDDYHFVNSPETDQFFTYLLANIPNKFHVVILSRTSFLRTDIAEMRLKGTVNYIDTESFKLDFEDVVKYCALCGVNMPKAEQERLHRYSDGWISPLSLSVREYATKGSFTTTGDLDTLVRDIVYNPLSGEIKEFLSSVCVFDYFTLKQAAFVWQRGNVEALLEELIRSNVFITANAAGFYSFHHLFMSHVLAAFDALSEQKRASIWKRAGEYYLNAGETIPAMNCFMKTGDFAAMLTALVSRNGVDLTNTQREKVIACLDGCPDAVLGQNLSAVLVLARCMFSYKEMTRFGRCIAVFENNIGAFSGIESERNALMMNYERFLALSKFNSIEGMSYHHRRALDYKDDKYRTEEWSVNWTFGSPSILMLYHSKNGALAEELTQMRECMPIFVRLSEGVGSGSEFVMEAEAAFYAGDFAVAETIIHKAQYYAREKNQWSILLAAEFLRMRLSLVKGDWFETANIQQQVADMVNTQKLYLLQHTIDIIWSYIYLLLGIPDRVAGWITDGDFTKTRVMFPALPALYMVYNRHLLATGEYLKVCSGAAVALNISSYYPQPFGSIWAYIYLAAAYSKLGQRDEALSRLMTSLDIALPDNLLMPFVDNGEYIADLLSELAGNEQYADGIARIFALYKDFSQIRKKLMREHFSQNAGALTERELAVARMASEGLSNRAIGTRLFLSEDGVKSRLKSVFEKLGVTSRKQLANKLKP